MAQSLFTTYTNRLTGRTTVMHGMTLCGYVSKVADANRSTGFYYSVEVAKHGDVMHSWCQSDKFSDNVAHVQKAWSEAL